MTRDDIIRMAHLAGYIGSYADNGRGEQRFDFSKEQLIEFAKLVAAHEREACVEVCDNLIRRGNVAEVQHRYNQAYEQCKDAIRARDAQPPIG